MAQEKKTNLKLDGNSNSNQTLKFHKENEFTNLTLEQLFSEPVSLRFIQREDDVISDDPEDEQDVPEYNFLELDFEQLFNIPVSINPRQQEQDDQDTSQPTSRERSGYFFDRSAITEIDQDSVTTVFVKSSEPEKITLTTPPPQEPTTPELPPPLPIPEEPPPTINDVGYINETQLFLSEAVSITGNLLSNDNISIGSGRITSVNGVINDDEGDLDSDDPDTIEIETSYGTFEVDVVTGDYTYNLLDASSVDDVEDIASETITYIYEFDSGGTYTANLTVFIDLNRAPIGVDDAYDVNQDIVLNIATEATGVLGNDLDPDNSSSITDLKFVSAVDGVPASVGNEIALSGGGLLTLNLDGTFTFDPNGEFDALMEGESATVTFDYTIVDSEALPDTATVTITVHGVAGPGITEEPINMCEVLDPQTELVYRVPCEEVEYYESELGYDVMPALRMADVLTVSPTPLDSPPPLLSDPLALEQPEWVSDF